MSDQDKRYHLEIYYPGSHDTVTASFQSDSPFQAISTGDIIVPFDFEEDVDRMGGLRVTSVEHIIWASPKHGGKVKHKLCVYTEPRD